MRLVFVIAAACLLASAAYAAPSVDPRASETLAPTGPTCLTGVNESGQPIPDPRCTPVLPGMPRATPDHAPGSCHVRLAANGMQLPDPACTPGAVNPTITAEVLRDPAFRTGTVRDQLSSAAAKRKVYAWYGIVPPKGNTGQNQVCELDHLVSLGLGGSDDLANVWPQCGPAGVRVGLRDFKVKDAHAELSLMRQVKAGADLKDIQRRIAEDWTQFLAPDPAAVALADWRAKFCSTDKATSLETCSAPGH